MITFFRKLQHTIYAVEHDNSLNEDTLHKLQWLFGNVPPLAKQQLDGLFIGPRKEMVTPWSTNAVEITQNMGISNIIRIEEFFPVIEDLHSDTGYSIPQAGIPVAFDRMLQVVHQGLNQKLFTIDRQPESIVFIDNIARYNLQQGLALSKEEVAYLQDVSNILGRPLTDSEVFGFSQVNSEHCRHKIFNGTFIIDGKEQRESLFSLIKKTSKNNPGSIISAYKDNVAFLQGPRIMQFAPERPERASYFCLTQQQSILALKAETHNFPTTVEPFNGAATGSGGEIRDRLAGGTGSHPLAGTAVYMTAYPRLNNGRSWEKTVKPRPWLYQTPEEILIKASNGASDFGNKFGQPLIAGSLLTFEHAEGAKQLGYDKVIMLAGGIGFGKKEDSQKGHPKTGDKIVVLGGDNYRIGMGGGAVSSVATGEYESNIELNAVQRSNPEMQKRVANVIRALAEMTDNPIVSVHDHGAGGHLNALSELVESTGGIIYLHKLPVGDPTLSAKEIIGNESQERMGLIVKESDIELLQRTARRERAPMYIVGEVTGDMNFAFVDKKGNKPIDLQLSYLFGKSPKTVLRDVTTDSHFQPLKYNVNQLQQYIENLLQIEAVACKDWLTNKVDRSVTGRVAKQQCCGELQLPLNNVGVSALDYTSLKGIATAIGHAPVAALVDVKKGSQLSIAEALTNIIWAPLANGLDGVSLSANWMWPARNTGENARLYRAVEAVSETAIQLGINIPTGKDSLSMTQKYPDGRTVQSPGTVIISAMAEVSDITKVVEPVVCDNNEAVLIYLNLSGCKHQLGGSSFAQILNQIGVETPCIANAPYFRKVFNLVQELITDGHILAGHDVSAGGLITTLLEMTFATNGLGLDIDLSEIGEHDIIKLLMSENPALVFQTADKEIVSQFLNKHGVEFAVIGKNNRSGVLRLTHYAEKHEFNIEKLRDMWFKTSYLLDSKQSGIKLALDRFNHYKKQPLNFRFPENFTGLLTDYGIKKEGIDTLIRAAIIREKGVNGDREMAYALHLAGFDVKDIHTTDLIAGTEALDDVNLIVFVGGFSNSDVLGSAKGWAGALLYNPRAKATLKNFYSRNDTMSLGICNGCQLMVELDLIYPEHEKKAQMLHNDSNKFESAFLTVTIEESPSIMLKSLQGTQLGVWVAHGEGKFSLPYEKERYNIPLTYSYSGYPGNPNGSDYGAAAICSRNGRHLAMMPHLERAIFPWNWAHYPKQHAGNEVSPWIEAFINARRWLEKETLTLT